MKVDDLVTAVRDAATVRRVFGEPYSQNGNMIIPVAQVAGAGGGGGGSDPSRGEGEGGGIGLRERPLGVYVIRGDTVLWRPAVDVNRVVAAIAAVLVLALLRRGRCARAAQRRPRRHR